MLKSHYEKITLLVSVCTALTFVLILFLSEDPRVVTEGDLSESFRFGKSDSDERLQTLELTKDTGLMPGETITFVSIEDENEAKAFQIPKIILEDRSTLTVGFGQTEITGKLIS
jgi:hypothetical protein